jgi:hypothetical protein
MPDRAGQVFRMPVRCRTRIAGQGTDAEQGALPPRRSPACGPVAARSPAFIKARRRNAREPAPVGTPETPKPQAARRGAVMCAADLRHHAPGAAMSAPALRKPNRVAGILLRRSFLPPGLSGRLPLVRATGPFAPVTPCAFTSGTAQMPGRGPRQAAFAAGVCNRVACTGDAAGQPLPVGNKVGMVAFTASTGDDHCRPFGDRGLTPGRFAVVVRGHEAAA